MSGAKTQKRLVRPEGGLDAAHRPTWPSQSHGQHNQAQHPLAGPQWGLSGLDPVPDAWKQGAHSLVYCSSPCVIKHSNVSFFFFFFFPILTAYQTAFQYWMNWINSKLDVQEWTQLLLGHVDSYILLAFPPIFSLQQSSLGTCAWIYS